MHIEYLLRKSNEYDVMVEQLMKLHDDMAEGSDRERLRSLIGTGTLMCADCYEQMFIERHTSLDGRPICQRCWREWQEEE